MLRPSPHFGKKRVWVEWLAYCHRQRRPKRPPPRTTMIKSCMSLSDFGSPWTTMEVRGRKKRQNPLIIVLLSHDDASEIRGLKLLAETGIRQVQIYGRFHPSATLVPPFSPPCRSCRAVMWSLMRAALPNLRKWPGPLFSRRARLQAVSPANSSLCTASRIMRPRRASMQCNLQI
jgi:hypothetical protein